MSMPATHNAVFAPDVATALPHTITNCCTLGPPVATCHPGRSRVRQDHTMAQDSPTPSLTFPSMDGHSFHTLEQQVLMDCIDIRLLLCKDQHLQQHRQRGRAALLRAGTAGTSTAPQETHSLLLSRTHNSSEPRTCSYVEHSSLTCLPHPRQSPAASQLRPHRQLHPCPGAAACPRCPQPCCQSALLTGGGVFCRHSRRYTILASSFTYSTS